MIFPGEGFDPVQTLAAVEKERSTALYGVPTMFNAILAEKTFSEFDLSSLRTGRDGGLALSHRNDESCRRQNAHERRYDRLRND